MDSLANVRMGLVGYGAGLLAELCMPKRPQAHTHTEKGNDKAEETEKDVQATRAIDAHPIVIYLYGFLSCLGYGFILNAWSILSFITRKPAAWQEFWRYTPQHCLLTCCTV